MKPSAAFKSNAASTATIQAHKQLLAYYRCMLMSRYIDDVEIQLKRQNAIYFQISGAGHEASLAVAAHYLRAGHDWFFPYYRDRALCIGLGVTPYDMFLQAFGAAADPASGGRQMPCHWSAPDLHIVSESSPTGTQFLTAVGCAEASVFKHPQSDDVVYCSAGEGTTSEGWFFEALNTASLAKLPVIFHIEDNGYAISVPVAYQTAGGNISKLVANYPSLLCLEFDGCDVEACDKAWQEGIRWARARKGPVLMHAHVIRPYSHSLSDDERLYRSQDALGHDLQRDPIAHCTQLLINKYGITEDMLQTISTEIMQHVQQARDAASLQPPPAGVTAAQFVYSPSVDPTSAAFLQPATITDHADNQKTMVDLINACLSDEMQYNPHVLVFGEDVADASDHALLTQVKGKGGVFKVTHGLQRRFGSRRVFNSPLSESNIVGRAIGMALRGLKPVIEIQFFDYIWPAMMHLRSDAALLRWRSNNGWSCPLVIRCTYGGYLKGGAVYHSQTGESIFTHIPGLRVVLPSTALDANGLLRTAIRCDDPVLFLEHKHLYRQPYNRAAYPGADFMIPFGQANILTTGRDITIITYGALVKRCLDAAEQARMQGISVEVIDLRTLSPYDWDAIATSVKKTGKVLVAHEECRSWGFGAEISARIAEELFDCLDGPVQRIGALDTFVGYHPDLEDAILPQTKDIFKCVDALARY